jgi:hypothetical protein
VALKLAEGFGLSTGEALAGEVPEAMAALVDLLPDDKGEQVGSAVYGYASDVVDKTNLRAAVAMNFVRSTKGEDDELTSYAVHANADGNIRVPSIVTLGVGYLAATMCDERLAALPKNQRDADRLAVQEQLRQELSINVFELIDGSELLNEFGVYRTVTPYSRNIEIEWDPTESRTEQCRLTVRYGVVMKGRPVAWDRTIDLNIPTYQIWDEVAED